MTRPDFDDEFLAWVGSVVMEVKSFYSTVGGNKKDKNIKPIGVRATHDSNLLKVTFQNQIKPEFVKLVPPDDR